MTSADEGTVTSGGPGYRGAAAAGWRWLLVALGARTLAGQLALAGIAWIAVWAFALLLAFNVLLSSVLAGQVDSALRARSEAVAATVTVRDGQIRVAAGADEALDAGTSIYLGETLVEGVSLGERLRTELVQQGPRATDRELLGPVRYLATPIRERGRQIGTIVVSSDIGERSRTAKIVGLASVGFVGLLVLFTFFALRALIRRAMRPVDAMGDQASAWSDKDIDRRFDPGIGPLELRHLALTLNSLLERISATVRHERRLTAELSHEIRTPLAHLHAEVELLSDGTARPATSGSGQRVIEADDLDALLVSIRRLEGLVETALAPARIQHAGAPGLGRVNEVLAGLAAPPGANVRLVIEKNTSIMLSVEPDVARRALAPVLENAWRYAVHEVRVDVGIHGGHAHISVSDDGGRLDPGSADSIFEPGFRADRADGHPGAGLGLALTRRICRSAGGDVVASATEDRTTVTLILPCLPQ